MNNFEKKEHLTRIPQILNYNNGLLDSHFDDEADLVMNIAILGTYLYKDNLWGYSKLTLEHFVKLGYTRTNLQRVIPKFQNLSPDDKKRLVRLRRIDLGLEEGTKEEQKIAKKETNDYPFLHDFLCITKIDYAFYKALNTRIQLSARFGDNVGARNFIMLSELLIKDLSKREKKEYQFIMSAEWVADLFKSYNLIDIEDYIFVGNGLKIDRVNSARIFYLQLGKMISVARNTPCIDGKGYFDLSVDQICDIVGIQVSEPKNRKRKVTQLLNDVKNSVKYTPFEWEYFSNTNPRAKYLVRFIFEEKLLQWFDEGKRASLLKTIHNDAYSAFQVKTRNNGLSPINALSETDFWRWWISPTDEEIKQQIKQEAEKKVYRVTSVQAGGDKPKKNKYTRISFDKMNETALSINRDVFVIAKEQGYMYDEKTKTFYKYN